MLAAARVKNTSYMVDLGYTTTFLMRPHILRG